MIKDSGSNYSFYDGAPVASGLPSSKFDESYINTVTMREGQIVPTYYEYTLLGDTWNLSVESALRVINTPVVPLMSRQRMFFHTYYATLHQLWKYATVFMGKGRTTSDNQDIKSMTVPTLSLSVSDVGRGSLADLLGFNFAKIPEGTTSVTVPAFKFMMYLKLIRDNYIDQRLFSKWLEDETASPSYFSDDDAPAVIKSFMFPRDDADFRIGTAQWDSLVAVPEAVSFLFGKCWYRDYAPDYFVTARPSPIFDDEPEADLHINMESVLSALQIEGTKTGSNYDTLDATFYGTGSRVYSTTGVRDLNDVNSSGKLVATSYSGTGIPPNVPTAVGARVSSDAIASKLKLSGTSTPMAISGLTADALRNLMCANAILEKQAKTNGDYGEFGRAYFGVTPKASQDFKCKYIGGNYQPIVFSDVMDNSSTGLGDFCGKGMSANKGNIGTFFADDFGIILTVAMVIPDTYYCQGLKRQDTYVTAEDFYLPERSKLGMQAILNKELFNDLSSDENDSPFGYQQRYDEYRYRANEVHCELADASNETFAPFIETRIFGTCPTLSPTFTNINGFPTGSDKPNLLGLWRSDQTGQTPDYICQVLNTAYAVRKMPYKAEPMNIGF